ncbi:unnamed protein product [Lota lota]
MVAAIQTSSDQGWFQELQHHQGADAELGQAYAVPDPSAATIMERLVEGVSPSFGVPAVLHSNQGQYRTLAYHMVLEWALKRERFGHGMDECCP